MRHELWIVPPGATDQMSQKLVERRPLFRGLLPRSERVGFFDFAGIGFPELGEALVAFLK